MNGDIMVVIIIFGDSIPVFGKDTIFVSGVIGNGILGVNAGYGSKDTVMSLAIVILVIQDSISGLNSVGKPQKGLFD